MKKKYFLIITIFFLGINTGEAQYNNLLNFNDTNGQYPYGSLTFSGNIVYGMTKNGGAKNYGCIFSIHTDGSRYRDLFDFTGKNGAYPYGSLLLSANGKVFYGMTSLGGSPHDSGSIFSIDTDGTHYKQVHDFDGINGLQPYGSLILSGNTLYGLTRDGGAHGYGVIFSVDTSGTGFTNLLNFSLNTGESSGSLVLSGNNLYGMEYGSNYGVIFSIHTNGGNYKVLYAFNGTDGSNGDGSLTLSAAGNVLYGMTWSGGTHNEGVIFSIDTSGHTYKDLYNFNYPIGYFPYYGGLTLSGKKLYGMNTSGGTNSMGAVFVIDTNGNNYRDLLDFNGANGSTPQGLVTISGKLLYGMTYNGGTDNYGVIFKYDTTLYVSASVKDINCYGSNSGMATAYSSGGTSPYTYAWSNGGTSVTESGLSAGSYTVTLKDIYGATISTSVTITQPTILTYSRDSVPATLGCNGTAIIRASGGTSPYKYLWSAGHQTTDTIKNQCAGNYCCTVTDGNGCSFSACVTVSCANHYDEPICIVGLDTINNKYGLIWGRTNSPPAGGYGHYNIYKDTGLGFKLIHSQPLDSLSGYIDTSSNPLIGSATYKISTVDSCGESALSALHTTVFLTTTASLNAYHLSWTAYVGFTPTKYRIFRGPKLSALIQIDSVASNVLKYTDTLPPLGAYYAIEAVSPNGICIPTRHKPNDRLSPSFSGSFSNGLNTATLGINNLGAYYGSVKVYPNPSNGIFQLEIRNEELGINNIVEVYNVLGEQVYSQLLIPNSQFLINLSSQPNGVYFYRVITETGNLVGQGKLVIEK